MENTNTIQFQDDQAVFYLAEGNSYQGPYRPSEVYSMLQAKKITWVDYCYREKEGQWVRIADHPVFKPIQAAPPKPMPKVGPPPPPKTEPAIQWFLFQNDTQTGPYAAEELKRLSSAGQLTASAYVWQEKFTEWKSYRDVADFKSDAPAQKQVLNTLPPEPAKAEDRRIAPRKPLVAQIFLTNHKEVLTGICRDISVGGMQVLAQPIPGQVGETVRLNVTPPESTGLKAFVAEGVIVRVLEDKRGFSFRFTRLADDAKKAIESYIA
ncbi:MAG: DUF4339 domain-containing protein [Bdellovibrionales bacterium]|nr:DUF4339 domain-containing protein [Oligoflexia bacterium]